MVVTVVRICRAWSWAGAVQGKLYLLSSFTKEGTKMQGLSHCDLPEPWENDQNLSPPRAGRIPQWRQIQDCGFSAQNL